MCSEFKVTYRASTLGHVLDSDFRNETQREEFNLHVKLTTSAPVLVEENQALTLREMVFPQRPFPNSRLSGLEAAPGRPEHGPSAGGEQLIRIYERKTWREGFAGRRALVPLSSFLEPAYWGPQVGAVMEFRPPEGTELFLVPAIQITAQVPRAPHAFSLLTHVAGEQMLAYHHRQLVLLKPAAALEWLSGGLADPEEKFRFLLEHRWSPEFQVQESRRMASGWKARVAKHLNDLDAENAYRSELKRLRVSA